LNSSTQLKPISASWQSPQSGASVPTPLQVNSQTDIDESRLHPRQDPAHGAEANVAEGALGAEAFDVKLGDDAGLDQGNADFANIDVDDEKIPAHDIFCALPAANPEAMTEHRAEAVGDIKEHLVGAASGIARVGQMARFTDWL